MYRPIQEWETQMKIREKKPLRLSGNLDFTLHVLKV